MQYSIHFLKKIFTIKCCTYPYETPILNEICYDFSLVKFTVPSPLIICINSWASGCLFREIFENKTILSLVKFTVPSPLIIIA